MGGKGPRVSWLQGKDKSPMSSGAQGQAAFGHDLKDLMPPDTCCQSRDTLPGTGQCGGLWEATRRGEISGRKIKARKGEELQNPTCPWAAPQRQEGRWRSQLCAPLCGPTCPAAGQQGSQSQQSLSVAGLQPMRLSQPMWL